MRRILINIMLIILGSCQSDNRQAKVAMSGFVSGTFSLRAIEFKTDSTFYFRKVVEFSGDIEIYGAWYEDSNKIYLLDKTKQNLFGEMDKNANKINYKYIHGDSSLIEINLMHIWIRYEEPVEKVDYKKMERLSG